MSCILMSRALELFVKWGKQMIFHPHVLHPHVGYIGVIRKVRKTQQQNPKFGRYSPSVCWVRGDLLCYYHYRNHIGFSCFLQQGINQSFIYLECLVWKLLGHKWRRKTWPWWWRLTHSMWFEVWFRRRDPSPSSGWFWWVAGLVEAELGIS